MAGATKLMTAGGGGVNLTPATNIAADVTVNVPSVNCTLLSNKTAGTVLQVVQGTYSTETASSSTSWAATGLTAAITPTSSSNKIAVFVSFGEIYKSNGNANNSVGLRLVKNGVALLQTSNALLYTGSASQNQGTASFGYVDSPATTSATTYSVEFRNLTAAAQVLVQSNNSPSTIILMEIAA